jgi:hypothetical protein
VEAERRGSDRAVLQASDNVNETFELWKLFLFIFCWIKGLQGGMEWRRA